MPRNDAPGLQVWSQDIAYYDLTTTTVTGTTSATDLASIAIPANWFNVGSKLKVGMWGNGTANTATHTRTHKVLFGGTQIVTSQAVAYTGTTAHCWHVHYLIACTAIGTLFCQGAWWVGTTGGNSPRHVPIPGSAPAAVSGLTFSSAENLEFNITLSNSADTITLNMFTLDSIGA